MHGPGSPGPFDGSGAHTIGGVVPHGVVVVHVTPFVVVPHCCWACAVRDIIVRMIGLAHAAVAACFRNVLRSRPSRVAF
ncbi:MAG TPA: hypothetical protein VHN37_11535 [Actinomycetota bacterium]|nr:hypothetical protein [Actinomycetota bacterium]